MASDAFVMITASVLMAVGAFIDGWKYKVPDKLTYTIILAGWLYWGFMGWGPFGMSVAGAFLAGGLLFPIWLVGATGGGDVKLYAGFGAWIVPLPWFGFSHLFWAFCVSILLGGVFGVAMIWWNRSLFINLANLKEIAGDWKGSDSLTEIRNKARQRKPTLRLIPYGVPLTIGSLAYMMYVFPMSVGSIVAGLPGAGL